MPDPGAGKQKSFQECMMGILAELGRAEAYPDADPALVQGVREQILSAVNPPMDPAAADPMAALMGGGAPPMGGAPVPVESQQAMTRLPRPSMAGGDGAREMAADIERTLSGI